MRLFGNQIHHMSEPGASSNAPERLLAYVVCINSQCRYAEAFADLRDSPCRCPRCGGDLLRECGTCHMILRAPSFTCTNCGRSIIGPRPARPDPVR